MFIHTLYSVVIDFCVGVVKTPYLEPCADQRVVAPVENDFQIS